MICTGSAGWGLQVPVQSLEQASKTIRHKQTQLAGLVRIVCIGAQLSIHTCTRTHTHTHTYTNQSQMQHVRAALLVDTAAVAEVNGPHQDRLPGLVSPEYLAAHRAAQQ